MRRSSIFEKNFTTNNEQSNLFHTLEFFTNSPQYKNANIANFILALPLKINYSNEACNLEI